MLTHVRRGRLSELHEEKRGEERRQQAKCVEKTEKTQSSGKLTKTDDKEGTQGGFGFQDRVDVYMGLKSTDSKGDVTGDGRTETSQRATQGRTAG